MCVTAGSGCGTAVGHGGGGGGGEDEETGNDSGGSAGEEQRAPRTITATAAAATTSSASASADAGSVFVFWDADNASLPPANSLSAAEVARRLQAYASRFGALRLTRMYATSTAVDAGAAHNGGSCGSGGDTRCTVRQDARESLECSGLEVLYVHSRGNQRDALDRRLAVDACVCVTASLAGERARPCTLVLVAGDGGYCHMVSQLRMIGCRVIVLYPDCSVSLDLCAVANVALSWRKDVLLPSSSAALQVARVCRVGGDGGDDDDDDDNDGDIGDDCLQNGHAGCEGEHEPPLVCMSWVVHGRCKSKERGDVAHARARKHPPLSDVWVRVRRHDVCFFYFYYGRCKRQAAGTCLRRRHWREERARRWLDSASDADDASSACGGCDGGGDGDDGAALAANHGVVPRSSSSTSSSTASLDSARGESQCLPRSPSSPPPPPPQSRSSAFMERLQASETAREPSVHRMRRIYAPLAAARADIAQVIRADPSVARVVHRGSALRQAEHATRSRAHRLTL